MFGERPTGRLQSLAVGGGVRVPLRGAPRRRRPTGLLLRRSDAAGEGRFLIV